jgi:hypothetical protein
MYIGELPAGSHTFAVHYAGAAAGSFVEGGAEWQVRTMSIVKLRRGATILGNQVPLQRAVLSSTNTWTPWPKLSRSITLSQQTMVMVNFQMAQKSGSSIVSAN